MLSLTAADILFFMTPRFGDFIMQQVSIQLNEAYRKLKAVSLDAPLEGSASTSQSPRSVFAGKAKKNGVSFFWSRSRRVAPVLDGWLQSSPSRFLNSRFSLLGYSLGSVMAYELLARKTFRPVRTGSRRALCLTSLSRGVGCERRGVKARGVCE